MKKIGLLLMTLTISASSYAHRCKNDRSVKITKPYSIAPMEKVAVGTGFKLEKPIVVNFRESLVLRSGGGGKKENLYYECSISLRSSIAVGTIIFPNDKNEVPVVSSIENCSLGKAPNDQKCIQLNFDSKNSLKSIRCLVHANMKTSLSNLFTLFPELKLISSKTETVIKL